MYRNVTLKCLTEIAGIQAQQYSPQFCELFKLTIEKLKQVSVNTISYYVGVLTRANTLGAHRRNIAKYW